METIELTPEARQSFQILMRLIRRLNNTLPGVALVQNQAEAVEAMVEDKNTQQN